MIKVNFTVNITEKQLNKLIQEFNNKQFVDVSEMIVNKKAIVKAADFKTSDLMFNGNRAITKEFNGHGRVDLEIINTPNDNEH